MSAITINVSGLADSQFAELKFKLGELMAGVVELKKAQAAEKEDLVTLTALTHDLLAAFAAERLTPADAAELLTSMTAGDATIKDNITSIQAVLTPTPVPPPPPGPNPAP